MKPDTEIWRAAEQFREFERITVKRLIECYARALVKYERNRAAMERVEHAFGCVMEEVRQGAEAQEAHKAAARERAAKMKEYQRMGWRKLNEMEE